MTRVFSLRTFGTALLARQFSHAQREKTGLSTSSIISISSPAPVLTISPLPSLCFVTLGIFFFFFLLRPEIRLVVILSVGLTLCVCSTETRAARLWRVVCRFTFRRKHGGRKKRPRDLRGVQHEKDPRGAIGARGSRENCRNTPLRPPTFVFLLVVVGLWLWRPSRGPRQRRPALVFCPTVCRRSVSLKLQLNKCDFPFKTDRWLKGNQVFLIGAMEILISHCFFFAFTRMPAFWPVSSHRFLSVPVLVRRA